MKTRTQVHYTQTELFKFALVVIDQGSYKGGKLTFTETGLVTLIAANKTSDNTCQMCVNGWIDAMSAL